MHILARLRRVWATEDFVLAGLVREPVADPKLLQEDACDGRRGGFWRTRQVRLRVEVLFALPRRSFRQARD